MNNKVQSEEIVSYGVAGLGQNMVYMLSSTFLFFFYTDIYKVNPLAIGTIFLLARVWDAINDVLMGTIVDNTRTKWGKLRPYLLFSPIPIAILTILTFSSPNLGESMKIVYVAVTYIFWGMAYTVCDIPYWGLSAAMTDDLDEKNKIISLTRALTMVGSGIAIVVIPILLDVFGNGSSAYFITSIIISVIGCGLLSLSYFKTKERVIQPVEKTKITDNINLLFVNTPLLLILAASLLGFSRNMAQSAGMHFAKYNLGKEAFFSLLGGLLMSGIIISILIAPLLFKKYSKKIIFIYTSVFGAIVHFVMYLTGYDNLVLVSILIFLSSLSMGFYMVLQTTIIADSIDYLDYKKGKRAEGLCFSVQTFITKISSGFSAFVMGLTLRLTGFVEELEVQNASVHQGIFSLVTIVPAIGCILSIIPMLFYKFTDKDQRFFVETIKKRNEKLMDGEIDETCLV